MSFGLELRSHLQYMTQKEVFHYAHSGNITVVTLTLLISQGSSA